MKRRLILLLLIAAVAACGPARPAAETAVSATPLPAFPDTARIFTVVPAESVAGYEITEEFFDGAEITLGRKMAEGRKQTIGQTGAVAGYLALDFAAEPPQLLAADFTVDISTLATNRSERDTMLRNNWLESAQYPQARFVATAVDNLPAAVRPGESVTFDLLGDLTIREVTLPVRLATTAVLTDDAITADATVGLTMTDFGFQPPSLANAVAVENAFTVFVQLTATERGP